MAEFPRPSLTLITDRAIYRPRADKKGDPLSLVEAAIAGGVNIVQLRVRHTTNDLGLFAVAMRLRELTADKARFVVTGDLELAEKCYADGVLLPERSYRPSEARDFLGGHGLIGAFARSVHGAARAERGGADYVQVGPVFDLEAPTDEETGLILLRKVKDAVNLPVIAFGGIRTPEHVADCLGAGADGVAVTDAVTRALDPQAAAAALRAALDAAWRLSRPRSSDG
jgi:thiamine-phosphate pyrophosphorylase